MTNAEKADEICKKHIFDSNHFDCCMEMAQWKEQQMIDKACEEHCNCCGYAYMACRRFNYDNLHCRHYVKFKKAMEEQL